MTSNQLSTDYITIDFELFYSVVTLRKPLSVLKINGGVSGQY
ncbi:Uncharacterised protein [Yersinia enterocolitica]|uniref:Uncharacterized protein n=2 Tax=Yersinia TaxID=629 RepID=A0A0T9TP35_YERAE|nr:Uncharacterised protein [Yersinia kristensenii]CNK94214.1 Uncharacterised protein [Yersinia aleksiciae]CQH62345.1 Uncharacterised protein [Yersinia enterocolitica]